MNKIWASFNGRLGGGRLFGKGTSVEQILTYLLNEIGVTQIQYLIPYSQSPEFPTLVWNGADIHDCLTQVLDVCDGKIEFQGQPGNWTSDLAMCVSARIVSRKNDIGLSCAG